MSDKTWLEARKELGYDEDHAVSNVDTRVQLLAILGFFGRSEGEEA